MKDLILEAYGEQNKIYFGISNYTNNNNLAIEMYSVCEDEDGDYLEPWGVLTKNLTPYTIAPDTAFVDTNNMPYIEDFIKDNNLGKPTGNFQASGFCIYPEYKFNLEEIRKYELDDKEWL